MTQKKEYAPFLDLVEPPHRIAANERPYGMVSFEKLTTAEYEAKYAAPLPNLPIEFVQDETEEGF